MCTLIIDGVPKVIAWNQNIGDKTAFAWSKKQKPRKGAGKEITQKLLEPLQDAEVVPMTHSGQRQKMLNPEERNMRRNRYRGGSYRNAGKKPKHKDVRSVHVRARHTHKIFFYTLPTSES